MSRSAAHSESTDTTHRDMANAIRALSMDAVEAAKSGHPGMPLGTADVATVLYTHFLKHDPAHPDWPDRDRFVLSAGHGSMLLYSLLYLCGYPDIDIDQIRRFRQLGSRTAGHPEYAAAAGIETTTGPLGQGLATAVGMAIAGRMLAARFGDAIVDHRTYVLAGDGDLMEGISHEAISLAGHLQLNKLIVLYDSNVKFLSNFYCPITAIIINKYNLINDTIWYIVNRPFQCGLSIKGRHNSNNLHIESNRKELK